ncbi:Common central domain of tyrosinase [Formosa sp. Hel1_31_208]|uniref:tyrosinase family protein n=1 Tax=Formosa sp. Hel1_31_208 TaxID=1798225 RepID=UPI00087C8AAD|nr:tyrosinase family protein [Formosa sp. Hel1_31_208]SDS34362.1 Common central domain of tyrosinase [Formosa sp. Hel1_31_208]
MSTSNTEPTWYGGIRDLFTPTDIAHMAPHGIHLNDYDAVKNHAPDIYGQVASKNMPPGNPWNDQQANLFLEWMKSDYPKGTPPKTAPLSMLKRQETQASRIRKDVNSLTITEVSKLKKAFSGLMALDMDNPNSYFKLAGYHGLPEAYCMHHIPPYNPWHRAYLVAFENALRKVDGCEDVTLPYWDIYSDFPDILNEAPFDSYTLPKKLSASYPEGYQTSRNTLDVINEKLKQYSVIEDFKRALSQTDWEDYHGGRAFDNATNDTSISAHDGGHGSIGPTMGNQEVAAFDPIFWFYHCNIDRMLWEWQNKMHATDTNGLLSTITSVSSRNYFTVSALERLAPFTEAAPFLNTTTIIDSVQNLDVDYADPLDDKTKKLAMTAFAKKQRGSVSASEKFHIDTDMVNVRVKGVNRVKIPGSFSVHLLKDGKIIASKAFFQPSEVDKCPNCIDNPIVHFDFKLPLEQVKTGKLETWIEPNNHEPFGDRFPHKLMDKPTINVRLLLRNE